MRRGIGVAYTQNNAAKQKQLADLGETIQAERIGSVTNDLEALTMALQELAAKHKDRVKEDPILRARFRQLAQSLGADILSSRENIFSKQSGLDDFYHGLAAEVIHVCMKESNYTGPYVPMRSVLQALKRLRGSAATTDDITEDDVVAALSRLSMLGGEYATVQLGGETYINTVSSGGGKGASGDTTASDAESIMSAVGALLQARRRKLDGTDERAEEHRRAIANYNFRTGGGLSSAISTAARGGGGAESSSTPPPPPPEAFYPSLSLSEIRESLPPMLAQTSAVRRVEAALQLLIKGGQVWVDVDPTHTATAGSVVGGMSAAASPSASSEKKAAASSSSSPAAYTFSSGGRMHVGIGAEANAGSDFTVIHTTPDGRVTASSAKEPSSADVLEHPAVRYWFVAFLQ